MNFQAASIVQGVTFILTSRNRGVGLMLKKGNIPRLCFFCFFLCFCFMAMFGLSILAVEECGMSPALIHAGTMYTACLILQIIRYERKKATQLKFQFMSMKR